MKKMIGIGGSPRKGGNTDILLEQILRGAGSGGVTASEVQLRDYQLQPCLGCERCRIDKTCTGLHDGMQLLYPGLLEAGGIVLVSPVYNYNITALMKIFIDRLYPFFNFSDERPGPWTSRLAGQGRKALIAAVGEQVSFDEGGMDLALETMRRSLNALGYEVIDELPVTGIFHKGKIKHFPQVLEQAEALGRRLSSLIP